MGLLEKSLDGLEGVPHVEGGVMYEIRESTE